MTIPWLPCALLGALFGLSLSASSSADSWIFALVRWLEFHKLHPAGFAALGTAITVAMWRRPGTPAIRRVLAGSIQFLFTGMVAGYIGLAIWYYRIGQTNDGTDFLAVAWVKFWLSFPR